MVRARTAYHWKVSPVAPRHPKPTGVFPPSLGRLAGPFMFGCGVAAASLAHRLRVVRWSTREAELLRQAYHDPLTGLPNRTLMLDRLAHALIRSQRSGAPVTVLLFGIDGRKTVNDSLGHAAGDRLLAAVAKRLT